MKIQKLLLIAGVIVMAGLVAPVSYAVSVVHYIDVKPTGSVQTARTYKVANNPLYDESKTYLNGKLVNYTWRHHLKPGPVPTGKKAAPVGLTAYVPQGTFERGDYTPPNPEPGPGQKLEFDDGFNGTNSEPSEFRNAPTVGIWIHTVRLDANNRAISQHTFYVFDPFVQGTITIFVGGGVHTPLPKPSFYYQPAPTPTATPSASVPYIPTPTGGLGFYMAPTGNYAVAPTMFGTVGGAPVEIYCF